jgi:hypothetical protein
LEYLYINIDRFKSLEFSLDNKIKVNKLDLKIGLSLLGKSDRFDNATQIDNEYLYKLNGSLSAFYTIEKYNLSLSLTHKLNGKGLMSILRMKTMGKMWYIPKLKQNPINGPIFP